MCASASLADEVGGCLMMGGAGGTKLLRSDCFLHIVIATQAQRTTRNWSSTCVYSTRVIFITDGSEGAGAFVLWNS